ncbi:hypothetical protein GCM10011316_29520 [Roseibium aquae]|uniref:Uncharacterized protein n=1 Tax=Roseibium aquae TaxID=1323746 RepID=A0A916X2R2_9HYPH|nr:hypothetical protein [Roseibium aquae]GGB55530.1 hypothetical protein GCM10011316_29520 [Roseibium aquae]
MQFRLCEPFEFWWPVRVTLPDPDRPGSVLSQTFEAKFLMVGKDRLAELEAHGEAALLSEILRDWRGVTGAGGSEIPFGPDALEQCLPFAHFRVGVYRAYLTALNGQAAAKNG